MSLEVFGYAQSRAFRALWMAEEIKAATGQDYSHDGRNFFADPETNRALLNLNPMGQVPVIKDDDFVLRESMAINFYLAEKYGVLNPSSLRDRATAWQWAFWMMTAVESPVLTALSAHFGMMGSEKDPAVVNEQAEKLQRPFGVLNDALADSDYLLGDEFTVADLNVASVFTWVHMAELDLSDKPNLLAWMGRCLSRPAVQKLQSG